MKGLISLHDDARWTDWRWPNSVSKLLQEIAKKDFYKSSFLTDLEMLALAKKYSNSQFTKACIEYRAFTEGTYFSKGIDEGWGSKEEAVFRQPFVPSREIEFWPKFLRKYPGHPGSDDAMYRLARAYEMKGNYEAAILWYHKASQEPDGDLSYAAEERILFIIDFLMSSNSLANFLKNNPKHPLYPYILYSQSVHLMREGKVETAKNIIAGFIKTYRNKLDFKTLDLSPNFRKYSSTLEYSEIESKNKNIFWNNVQKQLQQWQGLARIHALKQSDESIYQKAAFWFHNELFNENHLWFSSSWNYYQDNVPNKWDGVTSSLNMSITYKLVKDANRGYESKNRYLRSIRLFQKLPKDYPNSKLAIKAKYSIGLNYYYLSFNSPMLSGQEFSWGNMAIKSFQDFVESYPQNSMADDALLSIAEMEANVQYGKPKAVQILKKLLINYPNGDRRKEAQKMLYKLLEDIRANSL